ncbi:olfactomedin-4-like [Mantella aurantiaca]
MLFLLLLSLGISWTREVLADIPVTGHLDNAGVCYCSVNVPDAIFPADKMEILVESNYNLSLSFQQEIAKLQLYQRKVDVHVEKMKNLTRRVELMQTGGITYTELEFELIKAEITQMEALVVELRSSLTGSNDKVEALYAEVHNISVMVNQLEKYDKNNVLAVRREIVSLQRRLQECKLNQTQQSPFQEEYGSCEHGGIMNISKPLVILLNWRGANYKAGGWGKDSYFGSTEKIYWVSMLEIHAQNYFSSVRVYNTYDDLLLYKNYQDKSVSGSGSGAGMILYNNSLYYNCYNSKDICKLSMNTNKIERKTLPNAVNNNRFSYSSSAFQDIDMAGDEYGLWVLYSTEEDKGHLVIGKVDANTLELKKTWTTGIYKPSMSNAFMVCGIMYATRAVNTRQDEIFYMYDTNTNKEDRLSILMDKMTENIQSISYNSNDHKLYVLSDAYEIEYKLFFKPKERQ